MATFSNNLVANNGNKVAYKYFCESCNYTCSKKYNWDKHLSTTKHKIATDGNDIATQNGKKWQKTILHICNNCNKEYNDRTGLWRHKKKCIAISDSKTDYDSEYDSDTEKGPSDKEVIMMLIKENSEFKNMMMKVLENGTHNTTNNNNINSNNKSFNLQFFLNETCKNAMNITDFVDSLQLQMSDLEKVGEIGYIEGISNIIIKKLNTLDITERPIHCTDKKRETMYIKDEDKWEKEDEKHVKMHKMVKKVANKNINLISEFQKLYPEWKKCSSKYADQYNKIVIESMGGKGDNDYEKEEKIIKKIAKEVFVEK
jgi:hypothetical protein